MLLLVLKLVPVWDLDLLALAGSMSSVVFGSAIDHIP